MTDKVYTRHTGHPGGQRFASPKELMAKDGRKVVEMAVKGMLPKTDWAANFTPTFMYMKAVSTLIRLNNQPLSKSIN